MVIFRVRWSRMMIVNNMRDADALWRNAQSRFSIEAPVFGVGDMGICRTRNPRVGVFSHAFHHLTGETVIIRVGWRAIDPPESSTMSTAHRGVRLPCLVPLIGRRRGYAQRHRCTAQACDPPGVYLAYRDRHPETLFMQSRHEAWRLYPHWCCNGGSESGGPDARYPVRRQQAFIEVSLLQMQAPTTVTCASQTGRVRSPCTRVSIPNGHNLG